MKKVSPRQADHDFSELLSRAERGEEILITKRSKPVALLCPYARSPRTWNADGVVHLTAANARRVHQQRDNSQGGNRGRRGPNNDRRVASGATCRRY
jgi:prevent-host-death family protein